MADSAEKRALIAQLDRERSRATAFQRELKEDLKLQDRMHEVGGQVREGLKDSVDQHRGIWLGAAALVGLVISKIPPRTKVLISGGKGARVSKEAKAVGKGGLVLALLGWVFNLVRPMLVTWGTKRLAQVMNNNRGGYRRPIG